MVARPHMVLMLLILAGGSLAADPAPQVEQATVYNRGGWLHADIQLRDLIDSRTASTVDSGLSGVCAYEVRVLDESGREVAWTSWLLHLEHDLWEDRYLVRSRDQEWNVPGMAAMDSLCSDLRELRLAPLAGLDAGSSYQLAIKVEVQPLAAEDRDRLARYVTRRGDRNREDVDFDLGSLFGRLFTGGGARRTGVDFTSSVFRPHALERRP